LDELEVRLNLVTTLNLWKLAKVSGRVRVSPRYEAPEVEQAPAEPLLCDIAS